MNRHNVSLCPDAIGHYECSVGRLKKTILNDTKTFYHSDTEPCVKCELEMQVGYHGTGPPPLKHPGMNYLRALEGDIPDTVCGYCQSENVLVIALQGCVHPMSGDAYYDYGRL